MAAHPLRDRAAIAGIGYTELSKDSGVSTLALALRAIATALADAGLSTRDVDGVACHRVGDSAPAALVAQALGDAADRRTMPVLRSVDRRSLDG